MKPISSRTLLALLLAFSASTVAAADAEPARCQYTRVARLPLQYTGPALQITTEGSIDGTPARMLVDTGAHETFLTRTGTERRGMSLHNTGKVAHGAGGSTWIYETRVSEFSAGPARTHGRGYMQVLNEFGFTPSFDALLGSPFLLQTDLEISLATKEITFFRPKNCKDSYLGYWNENVLSIPFERPANSGFTDQGLNPHFTVQVNGQKMRAMIDTGAQVSLVSLAAARRAGFTPDAPGVTAAGNFTGVGERKQRRWLWVFKNFQIGEESIGNADLSVTGDDRMSVDVILGADFLRAHRVLFAMSQDKLYFSYIGGEPFGQHRKLEPWIQAEADGGNADAQMALAAAYQNGEGVTRDEAAADRWLDKAAAGGSPQAILLSARKTMLAGDFAAAAPRLRAGLDKLPSDRQAALWLYRRACAAASPNWRKRS
ncbi:retroviral-like aspartic protease family protein [Massilia sp. Se16.2.3]|uniref:retroviral-like aspartic protease family protein n=1 Tax=Massilia sp. Se16.2.3 TaxID=2709303 RepID=UPI0016021689|nr:retroviral-like aspartic protease family protein [Massilia sp. Se16.2.3]QNA97664.1 hypothetical protein G4G31_00650 [Massilia sp. Se16.2.3]